MPSITSSTHIRKKLFSAVPEYPVSGFLWDSQFGRFFNTGPITGKGDPFFFLHTLIWAFLPWSILMYYAMIKRIRKNIPRINHAEEFYTISGSLLTLLVFSFSGFQLPHYTNIIFPLLSILTADFIYRINSKAEMQFFTGTQYSVIILTIAFLFFLQITFRPEGHFLMAILAFIISAGAIFAILKYRIDRKVRIFYFSCLASIVLNFYLNLIFYPQLLYYQSGSRVAEYANARYPGQNIRTLGVLSFTVHFHANAQVRDRTLKELEAELQERLADVGPDASKLLVFTSQAYLDSLKMIQVDYEILEEFDHYHTTMVSGTFLNHKTRNKVLRRHFLVSAEKLPVPFPTQ